MNASGVPVDCGLPDEEPDARAVAFKSLGCRVNFEEIECLRGRFVDAGWRSVDFEQAADLYVINTCTVTGLADAESRKTVRRAVRRKRAGGLVVVTGCYAQRDPEALAALDGVDLVLGNEEKLHRESYAETPDFGVGAEEKIKVDDIMAARDRLKAEGARVLGDGEPKIGAHGKPVLFLHPKDFLGTLVELEQA